MWRRIVNDKKPAEDGQLVIVAAAEKTLYDEAIPSFNLMGKQSFFLRPVGNGAKMKLVVNEIMGRMMNLFSEGLVLSDKNGLDPYQLFEVLDLGAIGNPMFKMKGHSLALGDKKNKSTPLATASNEAFKKAKSMGLGELHFTAVYETVKAVQFLC